MFKKNPRKSDVILSGIGAAMWAFMVAFSIFHQIYIDYAAWFVLYVLSFVLWSAGFIVSRRRYRSNQEN